MATERKPSATGLGDDRKLWALAEWERGRALSDIAEELGVTTTAIYHWRKLWQQHGVLSMRAKSEKERAAAVQRALAKGAQQLKAQREAAPAPPQARSPAPAAESASALSDADKVAIVARIEDGELSLREAKSEYGVDLHELSRWRQGVRDGTLRRESALPTTPPPVARAPEREEVEMPETASASHDTRNGTDTENTNAPRISLETKRRVVQEYIDGISPSEIARRYGIARELVYKWRVRYLDGKLGPRLRERERVEKQIPIWSEDAGASASASTPETREEPVMPPETNVDPAPANGASPHSAAQVVIDTQGARIRELEGEVARLKEELDRVRTKAKRLLALAGEDL